MNEEQKQALIEEGNRILKHGYGTKKSDELIKIALASLTAPPVKLNYERDALAAENAALKVINEDRRIFIMNGVQLGYIKVPTVETDPALETIRIAVSPQEPTPATAAYLNSVRADVIRQLHSEQKEWALVTWQYDSLDALKRAAVLHGDSELSGVIFMLDRIEGFASQLHAGEPS